MMLLHFSTAFENLLHTSDSMSNKSILSCKRIRRNILYVFVFLPFVLMLIFEQSSWHTISIQAYINRNITFTSNELPSQLQNDASSDYHILFSVDEQDKFELYTLINSIIINEHPSNRSLLSFHILIYMNKQTFTNDINLYFSEYINTITFEIISIQEDEPITTKCIEYVQKAHQYCKEEKVSRLNNRMNLARFCLPSIFQHVAYGVYLDVDMIVQTPISSLFNLIKDREESVFSVLNRSPGAHDPKKKSLYQ